MQAHRAREGRDGGRPHAGPRDREPPLRGDEEARPAHRPGWPATNNVIRIAPALNVGKSDVEEALRILDAVVRRDQRLSGAGDHDDRSSRCPNDRLEQRAPGQEAAPTSTPRRAPRPSGACTAPTRRASRRARPRSTSRRSSRRSPAATSAAAARTIFEQNMLGYSCARVCPVEVLCEGSCVYEAWHQQADRDRPPAALRDRDGDQRMLDEAGARSARRWRASAWRASARAPRRSRSRRYLALEGHKAIVLEKRAVPGGSTRPGIAPYKLHADGRRCTRSSGSQRLGVEIRTGVEVGTRRHAAQIAARTSTTRSSSGSASARTRSSASRARTGRASSARRRGSSR